MTTSVPLIAPQQLMVARGSATAFTRAPCGLSLVIAEPIAWTTLRCQLTGSASTPPALVQELPAPSRWYPFEPDRLHPEALRLRATTGQEVALAAGVVTARAA